MGNAVLVVTALLTNSVFPTANSAVAEVNKVAGEDALHLLESLAAEQQKTLDRLKVYQAVFTQIRNRPGEVESWQEKHTTTIKKGVKRFWLEDHSIVNSPIEGVIETDWRFVANDEFAAHRISGTNAQGPILDIRIWEHYSYDTMSEKAKNLVDAITIEWDFTKTGYGNGRTALRDMSNWARENKLDVSISWEAPKKSSPVYNVKCYGAQSTTRPMAEFAIDSGRACIFSRCIRNMEDGNPLDLLEVEAAELEPGLWFPIRRKKVRFDGDGSQRPILVSIVELESFKPGIGPNDNECTLASLALPEGTAYNPIIRTDVRGNVTMMHVLNGELISRDVLRRRNK